MNKDNKIGYSLIGLIAMISVQVLIRSIGIDNLSTQVIVAFFTIVCVLFIIAEYKNKTKGFGVKYNMTVTVLMTLICVFSSAMAVIFKGTPDLINKYGGVVLLLDLLSFFGFVLYVAIYRIVYEAKRK